MTLPVQSFGIDELINPDLRAPLAYPQSQFYLQGGPAGQVSCIRSHPPSGAQCHGNDVSVTSLGQAREQP